MEIPREGSSCQELIRCLLGLKDIDMRTYRGLLESEGGLTADEMGDLLDRERSTAYRSLQRLVGCGIATKETRTIEEGGYFYIYRGVEPGSLKEIAEECLDEWYDQLRRAVNEVEEKLAD
ncbi:MAG: hypothetical protein MAG715_01256 [Methanonatronarchaeales archaeon]|nr:hypothetical protein [Methanonatronarchaeales archaeon]